MPVSLRDARTNDRDLEWIGRAFGEYLEDLGLQNTGVFPVLGEIGHREPDHLQRWLLDRSATLLTILAEGRPAGFAIVVRDTQPSRAVDYRMAEFFVARAHRRRGLGRAAVRLILDRFTGRWEVVEHARNPGAVQFWRRVIAAYTRGDYRERAGNGEVRQYFTSANERAASR